MTLWQLAQSWPHETFTRWKDGIDIQVCKVNCHRCQLEQWSREQARKANDLTPEAFGDCIKDMLGVPKEGQ